jgi:hypothetical protein
VGQGSAGSAGTIFTVGDFDGSSQGFCVAASGFGSTVMA